MDSEDLLTRRGSHIGSRLSSILGELQKKQAIDNPPLPERPSARRRSITSDIVVAVMGVTGSGKSSFIRRVSEIEEVVVGSGLQSVTQKVCPFNFENNSQRYMIVDTPGFNDTHRSDNDVLKELADWLLQSYRDGIKISGIIYLHRISDAKMEGSALRNLRMFRKLCGEDFMRNVILGTTFWDIVGEEQGAAREKELLETDGFFKDMKEKGCDVVRIEDDRNSNLEILSRFKAKQPTVLRIQQELFEGKSLAETGAASAVNQELAELQRRNLEKLSDVKHQAQKQITRSSLEKVLALHIERKTFDDTMEGLTEQQNEVRKEQEEEEKRNEERMKELAAEKKRQEQRFQVQLDDINQKLQAMKAAHCPEMMV